MLAGVLVRLSFLNKNGALSRGMSYNSSEAAMREGRGFPARLRKILYNFLNGLISSKSLGPACL